MCQCPIASLSKTLLAATTAWPRQGAKVRNWVAAAPPYGMGIPTLLTRALCPSMVINALVSTTIVWWANQNGPMPRQLGSSRCSLVAPRHPQRLGEIGIPRTSVHCNLAGTMAYLEVDSRHISPNSACKSFGKLQHSK